jgi:hypothetical protein
MKILERIIANKIRSSVFINNMQLVFRPGKGTTDAIFIERQVQERFLVKEKGFVDGICKPRKSI